MVRVVLWNNLVGRCHFHVRVHGRGSTSKVTGFVQQVRLQAIHRQVLWVSFKHFVHLSKCLCIFLGQVQERSILRVGSGRFLGQPDVLLERAQRKVVLTRVVVHVGQLAVGRGVAGVQLNGLAQAFAGRIEVTGPDVQHALLVVSLGVAGVSRNGTVKAGHGFATALLRVQENIAASNH